MISKINNGFQFRFGIQLFEVNIFYVWKFLQSQNCQNGIWIALNRTIHFSRTHSWLLNMPFMTLFESRLAMNHSLWLRGIMKTHNKFFTKRSISLSWTRLDFITLGLMHSIHPVQKHGPRMKKAYWKTFLTFKQNSRLHDHSQEQTIECFILAMVIMRRSLLIAGIHGSELTGPGLSGLVRS